jgi:hypothetical protein
MHEHHEDDPEVLSEIEKLGYDPRDVPVEKTVIHAFLLFGSLAVAGFFAAGVMWVFDRTEGFKSVGAQDIGKQERRIEPQDPYPLLQSNRTAHEDIARLRVEEDVKKHHYGWVDEKAGVVRMPVEDAMERVLAEGLPVTTTSAPPSLGVAPEGHVTEGPGGAGQ